MLASRLQNLKVVDPKSEQFGTLPKLQYIELDQVNV